MIISVDWGVKHQIKQVSKYNCNLNNYCMDILVGAFFVFVLGIVLDYVTK